MSNLKRLLKIMGACEEAVAWVGDKDLQTAWETCERADWMLWLCGRMEGTEGWPTRQKIVLAACLCAETALPIFEKEYPSDDRPRKEIEAARAWANGTGTIEEVREARRGADAAAYAADAAAYAADAAAYAADAAADAADAAADAYAYAAAYAYAYAAAAAYADAADRSDALRKMAVMVRENLKIPCEVQP